MILKDLQKDCGRRDDEKRICETGAHRDAWWRMWNYTWRHLPLATRGKRIIYRSSQQNSSHAGKQRKRNGERDAEFSAIKQNKNKERQVRVDKVCWWGNPLPFHDHAVSLTMGAEHVVPQHPAERRLLSPFTWLAFLVPMHMSHPFTQRTLCPVTKPSRLL